MHEKRNFALVIVATLSVVWAILAWFIFPESLGFRTAQRIASLCMIAACAAWLLYAFLLEDKLPDHMKAMLGGVYYDVDGLSFMPIVRAASGRAELSLYYQNRYENPVEAIVHLRPPEDSFIIRPGMRDVHFAFRADGGDFGVIHQPIAVPRHLQGEVINVQLGAASWYPRSHGARLRKRSGLICGSLPVDWGGAALKAGVHEVSGEVELINPVMVHLPMPVGVSEEVTGREVWKQQQIAAGSAA